MPKESLLGRYIAAGVVFLLTAAIPCVFIASSFDLKGGAGMFPLCMSGMMLFCGAMSFYLKFRRREPLASRTPATVSFPLLALLSVLLFCFIPLSMYLGFYATSFVYIVVAFLFLAGGPKPAYIAQGLLLAGVFVIAEKLIFYDLLTILTPTGILF